MNTKLYIPKKINVGYQERNDTYTGKLAYVIYWDDKGVLRKENSWNSWRNEKLSNNEIDNTPTEGFVLNKGVGGQRMSYGWNARNEYIRVFDPRGFEFEISVMNLLFILQECTSTKGKGLEGEFIYSWNGTELILLPVNCEEYKTSVKHTSLQGKKVTKSDMNIGCTYTHKDGNNLTYLGRFDFYQGGWTSTEKVKGHVFLNNDNGKYILEKGFTKLALKTSDESVDNYSDILEEFYKSRFGSPGSFMRFKPFKLEPSEINKISDANNKARISYFEGVYFLPTHNPNEVISVGIYFERDYDYDLRVYKKEGWFKINEKKLVTLEDGLVKYNYINTSMRDRLEIYIKKNMNYKDITSINFYNVTVVLESGGEINLKKYI